MGKVKKEEIMKCGKVRALLSQYLDKEISKTELEVVTFHLKECAGCSEYFREMKEQDLKLDKLSGLTVPAMDEEKVIKYWRAHKTESEGSFFRPYWRYITVPVAALMIFAVIKMMRVNKDFRYYELNEQQAQRLEYLTPEKQLRYRAGVILADLRHGTEDISLDELRGKISEGNFLPDIQKAKNNALKNKDYKTYDLFNKIEFILLDIMNEADPDFQLADFVQI